MKGNERTTWKAYTVAVLTVALGTGIALSVSHLREHGGFLLLLSAVTVTTWYGGFGPGLFAIALSAFVGSIWFTSSQGPAVVDNFVDLFRISLFVLVAFLINTLHTARARAERSFRENELRLGFALLAAGVGCWDAEPATGAFWSSANLASMFGRPSDSFAANYEQYLSFIHPDDRQKVQEAMLHPELRNNEFEIEHRIISGDGATRWVLTRGRAILNKHSKVEHLVGTVFAIEKPGMPPHRDLGSPDLVQAGASSQSIA